MSTLLFTFFYFFSKKLAINKNTIYIKGMEKEKYTKEYKPNFREKLLEFGPEHLNDSELFAILLRTGIKNKPVYDLSNDIIQHIDRSNPEKIEAYLRSIKGMGDSKISTVLAAMELGRRYYNTKKQVISHPSDIVPFLQHYAYRKQEHFICVSLNGANEIIAKRLVSVGIVNRTIVHPREVFAEPIKDRATSIIVAHNHPSGNKTPSKDDIILTRRLYKAGNILGINLLDHIILVSNFDFFSFVQNDIDFLSDC